MSDLGTAFAELQKARSSLEIIFLYVTSASVYSFSFNIEC